MTCLRFSWGHLGSPSFIRQKGRSRRNKTWTVQSPGEDITTNLKSEAEHWPCQINTRDSKSQKKFSPIESYSPGFASGLCHSLSVTSDQLLKLPVPQITVMMMTQPHRALQ